MLAGINKIYGIPYNKSLLATLGMINIKYSILLTSFVGSQLLWSAPASALSRATLFVVTSALKVVPFVDIAAAVIKASKSRGREGTLGLIFLFFSAWSILHDRTWNRIHKCVG